MVAIIVIKTGVIRGIRHAVSSVQERETYSADKQWAREHRRQKQLATPRKRGGAYKRTDKQQPTKFNRATGGTG